MNIQTLIILSVIGIMAGILSGFVGIGGGILIVPCLVYFLGLTQHAAQGTSLAMMLPPVGILAAYNYYQSGNLNWKYGLTLAAFFIIGGYFGSKLSLSIPAATVKKTFGVIMLLAALKLIFSK